MGVWWQNPQWGPGAEPQVRGLGGQGQSPLKLKGFLAFGYPLEAANLLYSLLCICCNAVNHRVFPPDV